MNDPTSATDAIDQDLVERFALDMAPRLEAVRDRIATAGGDVTLLAVSKAKPAEAVLAAHRLGLTTLGENYAQELRAKAAITASNGCTTNWHFIGMLQTNKVKLVADVVDVWQSVDRAKVATEIAKRSPGANVFAQVNLSDSPDKAGCSLRDLDPLVEHLMALGLQVQGLMGVGSEGDERATAAGFAALRAAVDRHALQHCSMGMTADLELAIAEGSTMVRIGSAIFGSRT